MHVNSIKLINYRNIEDLSSEFSSGVNIIYGDNGQGKTNLLESMYFLATGRSHRTSHDQELIRYGTESAMIRAVIHRNTGDLQLEVKISSNSKKNVRVNGVEERRLANLLGNLVVVFFSPDDIQLLKGTPSARRRFLDIHLSQLYKKYLDELIQYYKLLNYKNTVLKSKPLDKELLFVYNDMIASVGASLIVRRVDAVRRISHLARERHSLLCGGKEDLHIEYKSKVIDNRDTVDYAYIKQRFLFLLASYQGEEMRRQQCCIGPHRDDILFLINGRDARSYASQGQQRTVILSLKLSEVDFIKTELNESPVLILDDVTSELDLVRRRYLFNAIQTGTQCFVSGTDIDELSSRICGSDYKRFYIEGGKYECTSS